MSVQKKGILQITGLRGVIAFLIAYVLHWTLMFGAMPRLNNLFLEKIYGASLIVIFYLADVFFVLSGYLIHRYYNERIRNREIDGIEFFLPKIKKIYPLVVVTALITWGLQNFGLKVLGYYPLYEDGGSLRNSVFTLPLSFIGLQSGYISDNDTMSVNGPAWFVAILFLCYGIYYTITYLVKCKWIQNIMYMGVIALGIYVLLNNPSMPLLYTVNGRGYYSFFIGVIICECVGEIEHGRFSENMQTILKIISYIFFVSVFVFSVYFGCVQSNENNVLIITLFLCPSLVYTVIHGYLLRSLLSFKAFVGLGQMAMPIFLCNFPTNLAIRLGDLLFNWELDYSNPWLWIGHILISLIIVYVFHIIFESKRKRSGE